jgi:hypothetical protein
LESLGYVLMYFLRGRLVCYKFCSPDFTSRCCILHDDVCVLSTLSVLLVVVAYHGKD